MKNGLGKMGKEDRGTGELGGSDQRTVNDIFTGTEGEEKDCERNYRQLNNEN